MGYAVYKPVTPGRRPLVKRPLFTKQEDLDLTSQADEVLYTATPVDDIGLQSKTCEAEGCENIKYEHEHVCCYDNPLTCPKQKPLYVDISTQTEDTVALDHAYSYMYPTKSTATQHTTAEFSIDSIVSDTDSRFYTGLTLNVLLCLISTLKPFAKKLKYKMNVSDQILSALIRLRVGITFQDVGRRFQISTQLASAIFSSWINIMAEHLTSCVMWLPRDTIRRTLPSSFLETYPGTTCIIDCSEIFIQRPFSLKARAKTWSTYKSHNTAKFLIAIAPNGFIMYVSPLYGGRASDNFITKSCGFLNYLLPGDEVMADRGFTIAEDLCARQVKLNIPSFMKGRSQLTQQETIESRRIASVRIHVERAIARVKSYRILNTSLHIKSLKKLDKELRVVSGLCNLHDSLIRKNEIDVDM